MLAPALTNSRQLCAAHAVPAGEVIRREQSLILMGEAHAALGAPAAHAAHAALGSGAVLRARGVIAVLATLPILATACKPAPPAIIAPPPVPVLTERAVREDVVRQLRAVGIVESAAFVSLRPQVAGQVMTVHFREGQEVAAGDAIISLDPRPFDAAVRAAEATLARATALSLDAKQMTAQMMQAREDRAASQRELESAQARAEAARAEVLAAQAELEISRLNREYCAVKAPFAGRLGASRVRVGAIVKANETELVDLAQMSPINVAFSVREEEAPLIKEGREVRPLPVRATIPGADAAPMEGALWFADNRVERGTGQLLLKARFDNEDQRLWPGQFVNATVLVGTDRQAVTVPARAVQRGQQGEFTFVIDAERTAQFRPVRVRRTVEGRSVIDEGLDAGDEVVVDGHLRLQPGTKVSVRDGAKSS